MFARALLPTLLCAALLASCTAEPPRVAPAAAPKLTPQSSGTDVLFIGLDPVDARVVWAGGTRGTFARTTDGGQTWQAGTVPAADSLQFRDVHAVDARTAYLLSAGSGDQSRLYKTTDGGATWTLQFTNPEPEGFFDCMDFWDADHGIAFSDAVDGVFLLITTADGGATWTRVPAEALPPADAGEGSFAASGTCLVAVGDSTAYVGTGAGRAARILRTPDRGATWTVVETPLVGGTPTAGIATLAFRDAQHGAALGGEIAAPDSFASNVIVTADGGVTWSLAGRPPFAGAVYGAAYVPGASVPTLVATGPRGLAFSRDDARAWTLIDTLNHWSVAFAEPGAGWAVGPEGRITKIAF